MALVLHCCAVQLDFCLGWLGCSPGLWHGWAMWNERGIDYSLICESGGTWKWKGGGQPSSEVNGASADGIGGVEGKAVGWQLAVTGYRTPTEVCSA